MSYLDFDFPHTRFFESDLRELIKQVFIMNDLVTNFVSINAIKYANPIQWDITKSYEKNTVVIDGNSGVAYISVRPVPPGIGLTREQYWTKVFDLSIFIVKAGANFANSFESEPTVTATLNTSSGNWLVWDSYLYQALTDIHPGDRYVPGGNIRRATVEDFYNVLKSIIDNEIHERQAGDDALELALNEETDIRGEADAALHREILAEKTARENADTNIQTALQNNINREANTRQEADTNLNNRITQTADTLSGVIASREFNWYNRKFLFCGDSYGDEEGEWPSLLISNYNLAGRAYNLCVSGAGFVSGGSPYLFIEQIQNFVEAHPDELSSITDIVVCGGLNDSFSYDISTYSTVQNAMGTFDTYVKSVMPYAKISLGYIGNGNDTAQGSLISGRVYACRQVCRYIYYTQASRLGWNILHNVEYLLTGSPANIGADGVHPSSFGNYDLAIGIGQALISGSADYNYPSYTAQPVVAIGQLSNGSLNYKIHNNIAEISASGLSMTVNQGTTLQGGISAVIMYLSGMYFNNPVNVFVDCILYNASVGGSGTNVISVKGRLTFSENKVYLTVIEADGTGYKDVTYSAAGTLTIVDFDKTFDSMVLV